jgi:ABC-type spermidine/putrescine transport system permease subunit I
MAVWIALSIALACLCIGFTVACFAFGDARSDLEQETGCLKSKWPL